MCVGQWSAWRCVLAWLGVAAALNTCSASVGEDMTMGDGVSTPIVFPGKVQTVRAPSGRYLIKIHRGPDTSDMPPYKLILIDKHHHIKKEIVSFDRSV